MTEPMITQSDSQLGICRRAWFDGWKKFCLFAVGAAMLLLIGGTAMGLASRLTNLARQETFVAQIQRAVMPEDIARALVDLENAAVDTAYSRYLLALGFTLAAENLPAQTALRQRARLESEMARWSVEETPENPFSFMPAALRNPPFPEAARAYLRLLTAALCAQTGDEITARDILSLAPEPSEISSPELTRQRDNQLAYLYATAKSPEIFNPESAMVLARRALAKGTAAGEDWENCNDAALLDTLAMAHWANGDAVAAREISARALAFSPPLSLDEILANYRQIRRAPPPTADN